jgi:23S rRNA (uracil1939-C5)-methyltransferase
MKQRQHRQPKRGAPKHLPAAPPPHQTRITRVGADGDGVGVLADGSPLYIPFTLPDELILARPMARHGEGWTAVADQVLEASAARIDPVCRHFGTCGGCVAQHWQRPDYHAWKIALLQAGLRRAGYADVAIEPIVAGAPGERRRIDLAARRLPEGVRLGLHRSRSSDVVDLTECTILHPTLFALIAPLRALLTRLRTLRREASVVVNLLDSGPDLLLRGDAALEQTDRNLLIEFARAHGLPRVSWAEGAETPQTVCLLRPAITSLSGAIVTPPPGAFLQATRAAEQAIIACVLGALPDKLPARARVAELYAGCGTITFALAPRVRVVAFEGDSDAFGALRAAANNPATGARVEAIKRDLTRQPLMVKELSGFAVVILDPPHNGAPEQTAQIAASGVPIVVYVSCNPGALARDGLLLKQSGYRLDSITPIDQFLWSARLESVCVFRR